MEVIGKYIRASRHKWINGGNKKRKDRDSWPRSGGLEAIMKNNYNNNEWVLTEVQISFADDHMICLLNSLNERYKYIHIVLVCLECVWYNKK